jgi:uncharacterized membrane protein YkvA (DUF1232 family)
VRYGRYTSRKIDAFRRAGASSAGGHPRDFPGGATPGDDPWYAKLFAAAVVAYAISPIEPHSGLHPVLGYLDDLVLVPLGIVAAIRMIRLTSWLNAASGARNESLHETSAGRIAAIVVIGIWLILAALCARWVLSRIAAAE